ncbi:hypothetical protein [Streptomyces roseus]|uniref:hypothetical protein n=1 Tax=Streptomyces roseus TaxID=66430 RepID=UPI000A73E85B|nr:hypothetical protein [Streptomyces roseus]
MATLPAPSPTPGALRPVRVYDSWWTVAAASLAAVTALAGGLWFSAHVRTDPVLHEVALFVHLASLALGFGAVLAADWYGTLWLTGRAPLSEALNVTSRLHVPIWAGLAGLVVSGLMLHPDLSSPLTQAKIALVATLTVNGLQAGLLSRRLSAPGAPGPAALAWAGATALISQLCWWGSVVVGFINTRT